MNPLIANLQHQLRQWGNHWWARTALDGLHAWLGELHAMLPRLLREHLASGPQIQRLCWPLPNELDVRRPAELQLAPPALLVQRVSLPLAATRDLQRVLAFEIDKFTPFTAEQVHFNARIETTNAGRATVLLVALERERLAAIIQACNTRGLALTGIQAQGAGGEPLDVELLPGQMRPRTSGASRINRWLLVSAVALGLTLMFATLMQRQERVERMEGEVSEQRQQATMLEAVRRGLVDSRDAAEYLSRLKLARPTISGLLSDLSSCLGDATWVEQLEVRDSGEVTLSGQSRRASALITQARTCQTLQDAAFQGVIQPDAQTGSDRFSLAARLKQEAPDASTPDPQ